MKFLCGQGKVFAAVRGVGGAPEGFQFLGNCPEFTLSPGAAAELFATAQGADGYGPAADALAPAGDLPAISFVLEEFSRENLIRMLRARVSAVAGGGGDAYVKAWIGAWTFLPAVGVTSITLVYTGPGGTFYTEGVDYLADVNAGAIMALPGGAIGNGQQLYVHYTGSDYEQAAAFVDAPPYVWVRVVGTNMIDNRPFTLDCYKTRFPTADSIPLIGDRFASVRMRCRLFYDADLVVEPEPGRFLRLRWA